MLAEVKLLVLSAVLSTCATTTAGAGDFLPDDFVELTVELAAAFAAVGAAEPLVPATADAELIARTLDAPLRKHDKPLEAPCMLCVANRNDMIVH